MYYISGWIFIFLFKMTWLVSLVGYSVVLIKAKSPQSFVYQLVKQLSMDRRVLLATCRIVPDEDTKPWTYGTLNVATYVLLALMNQNISNIILLTIVPLLCYVMAAKMSSFQRSRVAAGLYVWCSRITGSLNYSLWAPTYSQHLLTKF